MISVKNMCRYIYILVFSALMLLDMPGAFAQADTATADTTSDHKVKKPDRAGHQLCISVDYFHPVMNALLGDRQSYEIGADYYLHNEYYLAAEGGFGSATVGYSDLSYNTNNSFFRFGFNKSVLTRTRPGDWDMMFIGLRLGAANVNRGFAHYTIVDSLWGNDTGSRQGTSFVPVWMELTGGVRVELVKGLSAGWNIRGKFMLNGKSFSALSPLYIAGYGRGDKNTVFDFNAYISYSIRWRRKSLEALEKKAPADTAKPTLAPAGKKENK